MTDDELFAQYRQSHEPELLDDLINRNIDRIYRFVASMLGRQESVEDIVQEVLLNVIRSIDQFRGESAFSTWIYRIASNRVYRYLEKERKSVPTIEAEQLEAVVDKPRDSPETNELKQLIDSAISDLSPALRAAMLLTTVEGLTPEQAAAVEGCTADNIHWRVHKARKILKEKLKRYF
jgi:RNA polymerase sigma-70 factor (ECF subfamily)